MSRPKRRRQKQFCQHHRGCSILQDMRCLSFRRERQTQSSLCHARSVPLPFEHIRLAFLRFREYLQMSCMQNNMHGHSPLFRSSLLYLPALLSYQIRSGIYKTAKHCRFRLFCSPAYSRKIYRALFLQPRPNTNIHRRQHCLLLLSRG